MSKLLVANLALALVLSASSPVFAAPDPTQAPAADSPAPSSAPEAQSPAPTPGAPATPPMGAQAAKKKSPNDIICKPDTGTGSRVGGVKICLTREEWKQREMD